MCLHKLSLVDDTMEAIGSPKKYQRLNKWTNRIIIGYIVYMFYQFAICAYIVLIDEDENNIDFVIICSSYLFFYADFVHILNALIWGSILGLVYL